MSLPRPVREVHSSRMWKIKPVRLPTYLLENPFVERSIIVSRDQHNIRTIAQTFDYISTGQITSIDEVPFTTAAAPMDGRDILILSQLSDHYLTKSLTLTTNTK